MDGRYEVKYKISKAEQLRLQSRLGLVANLDTHATNGFYTVTSLYFDDIRDSSFKDKVNGVNNRAKYRLRYYNRDLSRITLEKKEKVGDLVYKTVEIISIQQAKDLLSVGSKVQANGNSGNNNGNSGDNTLLQELKHRHLIPNTIIEYKRKPYVYKYGNVRITIDYDIRTSPIVSDFLDIELSTFPILESNSILEVKWGRYLPDTIRNMLQIPGLRSEPFSKYVGSREYEWR